MVVPACSVAFSLAEIPAIRGFAPAAEVGAVGQVEEDRHLAFSPASSASTDASNSVVPVSALEIAASDNLRTSPARESRSEKPAEQHWKSGELTFVVSGESLGQFRQNSRILVTAVLAGGNTRVRTYSSQQLTVAERPGQAGVHSCTALDSRSRFQIGPFQVTCGKLD